MRAQPSAAGVSREMFDRVLAIARSALAALDVTVQAGRHGVTLPLSADVMAATIQAAGAELTALEWMAAERQTRH